MPTQPFRIAIIGGGAAGFFAALSARSVHPHAEIIIYEKNNRPLQKVKITGGGRCNLTNSFAQVKDLKQVYPRGYTLMKRLFKQFSPQDTQAWFIQKGVALVTQEDQCVFPRSQQSQSVIDALQIPVQRSNIKVYTQHTLQSLSRSETGQWQLTFATHPSPAPFDCVIITIGGQPKAASFDFLSQLGHHIESPIPSLFTFNIEDKTLHELMGTVVETASVSIPGTKFKAEGALLVTHWGVSGPAVLRLSSASARWTAEKEYVFPLSIHWIGNMDTDTLRQTLHNSIEQHSQKQLSTLCPFHLPHRLWQHLLLRAQLPQDKRWNELGKKGLNKLVEVLSNDIYMVNKKGSFKDEFVTCGGVSLKDIQSNTLESKCCPGLYFAGEVLDIDAVTGGFNLQAAWTTGFVAGKSAALSDGQ